MKTILKTGIIALGMAFFLVACSSSKDTLSFNTEIMKTTTNNTEMFTNAYFAGGCFWCMEGIFEAQDGVKEAVAGYAGGTESDATYDKVSSGITEHREAVQVVYDPNKISYTELLNLYWRQIDPTDPDGQFADKGPQYTTAIYYTSDEEKMLAEESKVELQDSGKFERPIATQILPFTTFFRAEEYHQDYYKKSSFRYNLYKQGSGREGYIENTWEGDTTIYGNETPMTTQYRNYSLEAVKNANGRILLFFHANWCPTCQSLEKQILESTLPSDLTILKVDFDTEKEVAQKYQILTQSSFVQIDTEGNAYKRILGKSRLEDVVDALVPYDDILKQTLSPLEYQVTQM